jgi:hypothetical protein
MTNCDHHVIEYPMRSPETQRPPSEHDRHSGSGRRLLGLGALLLLLAGLALGVWRHYALHLEVTAAAEQHRDCNRDNRKRDSGSNFCAVSTRTGDRARQHQDSLFDRLGLAMQAARDQVSDEYRAGVAVMSEDPVYLPDRLGLDPSVYGRYIDIGEPHGHSTGPFAAVIPHFPFQWLFAG